MSNLKESKKIFHCVFLLDVLCSFVKSEEFAPMGRCWTCPEYARFTREADEADERVMDDIDRIRKYGYPKRFDVPKEGE